MESCKFDRHALLTDIWRLLHQQGQIWLHQPDWVRTLVLDSSVAPIAVQTRHLRLLGHTGGTAEPAIMVTADAGWGCRSAWPGHVNIACLGGEGEACGAYHLPQVCVGST